MSSSVAVTPNSRISAAAASMIRCRVAVPFGVRLTVCAVMFSALPFWTHRSSLSSSRPGREDGAAAEAEAGLGVLLGGVRHPAGGAGDGEDSGGRPRGHPGHVAERAEGQVDVRRGGRAGPGRLAEGTGGARRG